MGRLVTALDRVGAVTKRPPIWAVVAGGLVTLGGRRGRDAALRGGVAYGVAAVVANVIVKPAVHRKRPPGSEEARVGPLTSSFPSGHAATDLAFVFGVAQRVPALFPPLAACTFAAHWSLVRTRAHYLTDILAGGALGIAVAVGVGALWPRGGDDHPVPSLNAPAGKAVDEERLTTWVDGEEARLLVHIEPLEERDPPGSEPPGLPE
ncbi:MAG TPA: phosphatase PAP2 family protein [Acidimicrobiales bacterium]|nr:phosphatase PAP2 family protein [Acidimicrobiales bacterium]